MTIYDYVQVGGTPVVNNALTYYLVQNLDCPFDRIVGDCRCGSLLGLPGGLPLNPTMEDAPWYDPANPDVSSRFYGLYGWSIKGLGDTNRSTQIMEGIDDGAWLGRTRRTARQVRVEGMLIAQGEDALDYGLAWLSSALDGDRCGQHAAACGVTDLEYFTACPPERGTVPDFTPWTLAATNLATNPSFEGAGTTLTARTNLSTNPNAVAAVGFSANNSTTQTVTRNVAAPAGNPQGITTAAMCQIVAGQTISNLASMYNLDTLLNTSVARTLGMWVYVNASGYQATLTGSTAVPLTANTWTWITGALAANTYSGINVVKPSGTGTVAESDRFYVTGVTALATGVPRATIAGGVPFPSAGAPDPDLTVAWSGAVNGSTSLLRGVAPSGQVTTGGAISTATPVRSGVWSSEGASSLRIIPTGATNGSYSSIVITGLTAGKTYRFLATAHVPATQTGSLHAYARSLYTGFDTAIRAQAPNEAGNWPLEVSVTATSASTTIVFYNGTFDQDMYYDEFAVFEDAYQGSYFDGSTEATDTERYAWTGAENASTSTKETRVPFDRTQTDEEYAEDVDPLRRYLHEVVCTSGPLEKRRSSRDEWDMMDVEFTMTAGRPWVYSRTRDVNLPPTVPIIVQDIPYNLVPYPSAELAAGEVVTSLNAAPNPSVETNATDWATTQNVITAATVVGARSTDIAVVGLASYRATFTPTATGADSTAYFGVQQSVTLPVVPNGRYSLNLWATAVISAGAPTIGDIAYQALWQDAASTTLRTDALGSFPPAGGAVSARSVQPPAGATKVIVRAILPVTAWASGDIVRLYADAAAVTSP